MLPRKFLQLVIISVLCFQNWVGEDYLAVSCTDPNDVQESALCCDCLGSFPRVPGSRNHVRVSTLSQFKSPMVRANRPRRADSSLDHQHRVTPCSRHLQLCEHSPDALELPLCGPCLDPREFVRGSPVLRGGGCSLSGSPTRLDL